MVSVTSLGLGGGVGGVGAGEKENRRENVCVCVGERCNLDTEDPSLENSNSRIFPSLKPREI